MDVHATNTTQVAYRSGIKRVWSRLMPVLLIAYVLNYLDRTNIALAKTHLEVDLGISAEVFSVTSRAGTPSYLAPERFFGGALSERTELFSIGVPGCKAERRHCSRWSSSTGLLR